MSGLPVAVMVPSLRNEPCFYCCMALARRIKFKYMDYTSNSALEAQPMTTLIQTAQDVLYPDDDGLPLSESTKHLRLILTAQNGLDALFSDKNVFVAADLLWYPVEGSSESKAPDVMVIFGQDKRDRRSYRQWEEGNLGPQVTFEFVSKSNSQHEVEGVKLDFYQRHGVEEYYVHDPDRGTLKGWLRQGGKLQPIESMTGWVSPRLGIRFELVDGDLQLYHPEGYRFAIGRELVEQVKQAEAQLEQERQQRRKLTEQLSQLNPEQLQALGIDPDLLN